MWWPRVVRSEWELRPDYGRSPHAYVNQRLQIQLGLLMMSDIPLETCWCFNVLWNNKFRYQVASCGLLLLRSVVFQHLVALVTGMVWSSTDDSRCGFQKSFIYFLFNLSAVSPNHVEWNCRVVAKELVDRDVEGSDGGLIWGAVWALSSRDWGRQLKTELGYSLLFIQLMHN